MNHFILKGRAANSALIQSQAADEMANLGITPGLIDHLIDAFYDKIKLHEALGPIFNDHIKDNWPEHLNRMKLFWNALAFKTGHYGGKPVQAHIGVRNIEEQLFPIWLSLFHQTLEENIPSLEGRRWFYSTAERIARSLSLSLFYNPTNDAPIRSQE